MGRRKIEVEPKPQGRQLQDAIRARAFELYCERGREDGRELEDWAKAEREVCARLGVEVGGGLSPAVPQGW
jgi:hypothetical protein